MRTIRFFQQSSTLLLQNNQNNKKYLAKYFSKKHLPGCFRGENIVSSSCCISCCIGCILGSNVQFVIETKILKTQYLCGVQGFERKCFFYIICTIQVQFPSGPQKKLSVYWAFLFSCCILSKYLFRITVYLRMYM